MKNQSTQSPQVDKDSFIPFDEAGKTHALLHLPDTIIETDLDFNITGWNTAAGNIYGIQDATGKNIFSLDQMQFSGASVATMQQQFKEKGIWNANIRFKRQDGYEMHFRSAAHYITDGHGLARSIVITNTNITPQMIAEQKLDEIACIYQLMIDASHHGILLIGANGMIIASNKKATQILSLSSDQLNGKMPVSQGWKVFRPDGKIFPDCELPAVVSLLTGFPQKNVEMRIEKDCGQSVWISVSSQALVREGEFNPYAVVVNFTEIMPK
jgi:PAS domain S-box-containing protein